MATVEGISGRVGTISIGSKTLTVTPISQREEDTLYRLWEKIAEQGKDARITEAYRIAQLAPNPAMAAVAVQRIIDSTISGAKPAAGIVYDIGEETVEGVALNVFYRVRKSHPDVTLESLKAVVTSVNIADVNAELQAAIKGDDPKKM